SPAVDALVSPIQSSWVTASANSLTSRTVSTLTVMIFPTRRAIYSSSSGLLGSLTMPLRLSSLTWYWSITHSRAERLPRRYLVGFRRDAGQRQRRVEVGGNGRRSAE